MVLTTEKVCCVGSVRKAMVLLFTYLARNVPNVPVLRRSIPLYYITLRPVSSNNMYFHMFGCVSV